MPICPTHNRDLEPIINAPVAGGILLACPVQGCAYSRMPERKRTAVQPKLPMDPGPQHNRISVSEKDLQRGVVEALRLRGYDILVTTVQYRFSPCRNCGMMTRPEGGYKTSEGIPDIFVWVGYWKGLELKGTDTALSPAQKRLADEGKITIIRSIEDALEAVRS